MGSVNHPCRWLSGSLVGEGQDGAGCTQAQGHRVPLFVLPLWAFLPMPALRKPTSHLSLPSLPAALCLPLPPALRLLSLLLLLLIDPLSILSFHYSRSTSSISNNRGNICRGHRRRLIWVEWFQRRVLLKIWLPGVSSTQTVALSFVGRGSSSRSMRVTATRMCVTLQLR